MKAKPHKSTFHYQTNMVTLSVDSLKTLFAVNPAAAYGSILLSFIYIVFSQIVSASVKTDNLNAILLEVGFLGISALISVIAIQIALATISGKKISFFSAINAALENFVTYLGYTIVLSIIIFCGALLFILPAFIFAAWFSLIYLLKFEEGGSLRQIFLKSRELVDGRIAEFYAITFVGVLVSLFGLLGPIIPIMLLAGWYNQLKRQKTQNNPAPDTARSTYVIIIIGVIAVLLFGFSFLAAIIAQSGG